MDNGATETDPEIDTGSTDTSNEVTQSDAASSDADSTATVDSATAVNPNADGNAGSLASGTETTAEPPQTKPPEDWKKRHDGQFQANQRLAQEKKQLNERHQALEQQLHDLQAKLNGVDLQQVQQFQQHQQKSANPIWHPQNPDHARFKDALATHNHYVRLAQRASPEQRAWINEQYEADVSAPDREQIQRFQDHGRQELARLQMDPVGYMAERVDKLVDEKIQKFQQTTVGNYRENLQARGELGDLLQKYPELNVPEHLQRASELVGKGVPMASALREIRMEMLERRLSGAEQAKRSIAEKERLLQNNASISRDPAVNGNVDVYAEAKKIAADRKIKNPWDPRFMRILDELRTKYQLKD